MTSPRVSGFTIIKNGLGLGYPILESIKSLEPLVDEFIIGVGFDDEDQTTDDGTWEYLRDQLTNPKFKFFKSYWDPNITESGKILSVETNKALAQCQGRFCHYIQGDEVIHEEDYPSIEKGIKFLENHPDQLALIYNYIHFFGNVDTYRFTRGLYRREIRLIANHSNITSWLDAQGFRYQDGTKIKGHLVKARIFHYGWARKEQIMADKVKSMDKLYHGPDFEAKRFHYKKVWGLKKFENTHPAVMKDWIEDHRNDIDVLNLPTHWEWKNVNMALSDAFEKLTGHRIGEYKSFILESKEC